MTPEEFEIEIQREERELWREVYIESIALGTYRALQSANEAVVYYRAFMRDSAKADAGLYKSGAPGTDCAPKLAALFAEALAQQSQNPDDNWSALSEHEKHWYTCAMRDALEAMT